MSKINSKKIYLLKRYLDTIFFCNKSFYVAWEDCNLKDFKANYIHIFRLFITLNFDCQNNRQIKTEILWKEKSSKSLCKSETSGDWSLNKRKGHVLGLVRAERPVFVTIAHGGLHCKKQAIRPSTTDYVQAVLNKPESRRRKVNFVYEAKREKYSMSLKRGYWYIFGKISKCYKS